MLMAAGGLIWRPGESALEVLLISRPRRDWSLPKGKLDRGETIERCALREVHEETGFRCELGPQLPSTRYRDRRGRNKTVRYWAMTIIDGVFTPNAEVDDIRWLPIEPAIERVSARRDATVIAALSPVLSLA